METESDYHRFISPDRINAGVPKEQVKVLIKLPSVICQQFWVTGEDAVDQNLTVTPIFTVLSNFAEAYTVIM